jgi:hypothetical protein
LFSTHARLALVEIRKSNSKNGSSIAPSDPRQADGKGAERYYLNEQIRRFTKSWVKDERASWMSSRKIEKPA